MKKHEDKQFIIDTNPTLVKKVGGDLALAFWYSILKNYAMRMKKDKHGFIRVSSNVFKFDLDADRKKVWRYNKRLEDKGLITVDRAKRGGTTWIGYKFV